MVHSMTRAQLIPRDMSMDKSLSVSLSQCGCAGAVIGIKCGRCYRRVTTQDIPFFMPVTELANWDLKAR